MDFFGFFRRTPPIGNAAQLADFVDEQAAFLAQKGIYEYARARAGHYAKVLFGEPEFQAAVERSRWQAYPITLAMVGELAEGFLYPHAGDRRRMILDSFIDLVLDVFDRYPIPAVIGEEAWRDARSTLAQRLDRVGTHPPKYAKDIPEPLVDDYFALMPIHEKLRGRDALTTRNYLRVTMINIHEELEKRIDPAAVTADLLAISD